MKKIQLIFIMLSTLWLCHEKAYSQDAAQFDLNYKISVNGGPNDYYNGVIAGIGTVHGPGIVLESNTQRTIENLCPGDTVTITNLCTYRGNPHNFNGEGTGLPNNPNHYGKASIGLTPYSACGTTTLGTNSVTHLGAVYNDLSLTPGTYPVVWDNWNYNTTKTVIIPSDGSTTGKQYLVISARLLIGITPMCSESVPYCFTKIDNFGTSPDAISDQSLCPGEFLNLGLNSNYTYTNWLPNNPQLNYPSGTTTYTVDISDNTNADCGSLQDQFTITLNNPIGDLINDNQICANNLPYYFSPYDTSISLTKKVTINNIIVFDPSGIVDIDETVNDNLVINSIGTHTIVYEYYTDYSLTTTCTKEYILNVSENPDVNLGGDMQLCSNSPMPTLDAGSDGVTYKWRYRAQDAMYYSPLTLQTTQYVNTANHGYGSYSVNVTNAYGCKTKKVVKIFLSPSALANLDAGFNSDINTSLLSDPYVVTTATTANYNRHLWVIYEINQIGATNVNSLVYFNFNGNSTYQSSAGILERGKCYRIRHGVRSLPCKEWKLADSDFCVPTIAGRVGIVQNKRTISQKDTPELISTYESIYNESLNVQEQTVNLYPNPTNGIVNITHPGNVLDNTSIEVYSFNGATVYSNTIKRKNVTNHELDISRFQDGIYILKVTDNTGKVFTERIIKK